MTIKKLKVKITAYWQVQRIQELEIMLKIYLQFLTLTSVYNILTMKALPTKEPICFLDSVKIGQER